MKGGALWKISVATSAESEEAVVALLEKIFGQTASVYIEAETLAATASVYMPRSSGWSARKRAELVAGLQRIQACGLDLGSGKISIRKVRRQNWAESWKRHFRPIEIASALLVKPSWSQRRAKKNQAVVVLDPGLSFGTGQHPTTRFCLEQLVACRRAGEAQSFLDLGTGSGILAIAAAKLGYCPVDGLDFDPKAVRVARANARANQVLGQIRLACQDLTRLPLFGSRAYDFVCANMVFDLLVIQRKRIVNRLKPGGTLVLSGILKSQFPAVRTVYEQLGLRMLRCQAEQDWESGVFASAAKRLRHG